MTFFTSQRLYPGKLIKFPLWIHEEKSLKSQLALKVLAPNLNSCKQILQISSIQGMLIMLTQLPLPSKHVFSTKLQSNSGREKWPECSGLWELHHLWAHKIKTKKRYNYLTKWVPLMYEIKFLGWNFKSLKSSDMQSGIKASLIDLLKLWVSPPISLNILPL